VKLEESGGVETWASQEAQTSESGLQERSSLEGKLIVVFVGARAKKARGYHQTNRCEKGQSSASDERQKVGKPEQ